MGEHVILTRERAIKEQLDTAIWLWFLSEPASAVHALTDNALTILHDVGGKIGKESHFYSKEMHKLHGRDRIKGLSNFLKHGSKDSKAAYKFSPVWTEGLMMDAINSVMKIYPPPSLLMATCFARLLSVHFAAGRIDRTEAEKYLPKGVALEEVTLLSKRKFLETILPLFVERGLSEP